MATSKIDFKNKWILLNEELDNGISNKEVIDIKESEAIELDRHQNNIIEFQSIYRKYLTVKNNLKDFDRIINASTSRLLETKITDSMKIQKEACIETNRVFINFVTSFKSFVEDYILNYVLPKIYGKNSPQVNLFKTKTNELYDNHFAYRFLTRMRDFSIHHDLPIYKNEIELTQGENSDYPDAVRITPIFVKSHLLKNKIIKSKLKEDLSNYGEYIPVKPILESINPILHEIMKAIIELSEDKYNQSADKILEFENRFKEPKQVWYGFLRGERNSLTKLESENAKELKKYT